MNVCVIGTLGIGTALALIAAHPIAQSSRSLAVRVSETAGIRRNNYPANARVHFPLGALADAAHARLLSDGKEVPAQFGVQSSYTDGSVQSHPVPHLQLTVYEHFVATPVPVGAVTSPVSMLNPLVVSVASPANIR